MMLIRLLDITISRYNYVNKIIRYNHLSLHFQISMESAVKILKQNTWCSPFSFAIMADHHSSWFTFQQYFNYILTVSNKYTKPLTWVAHTNSVRIGTDSICRCKSKYYTITCCGNIKWIPTESQDNPAFIVLVGFMLFVFTFRNTMTTRIICGGSLTPF